LDIIFQPALQLPILNILHRHTIIDRQAGVGGRALRRRDVVRSGTSLIAASRSNSNCFARTVNGVLSMKRPHMAPMLVKTRHVRI
jgi:hypothetical protein